MYNSLIKLMSNIIDYAGMYPPANLEIETAFNNYLKYRNEENNFMLGKFVVSARKLNSLSILSENFEIHNPLELTVLLTNENLFNEYFTSLINDIKNIRKFDLDKFDIKSFELKLPLELNVVDNFNKLSEFFERTYDSVSNALSNPAKIFFELGITDEWKYLIPIFIEILADFRSKNFDIGFKLRTGGTNADMIPTAEQIALSIYSCNDAEIPFKATAGLHHPFRQFDTDLKAITHGFINVFGAGIIAYINTLPKEIISEIISEDNPQNFIFEINKFRWKNYTIEKDKIELARNNFMISFGSCDFITPIEELQKINLLK